MEAIDVNSLPVGTETAVVVLPGRSHAKHIDAVNAELSKVQNLVLFIMGDEEATFPVDQITHPNIRIWVQNARPIKHDSYRRIGTGYPGHMTDYLPKESPDKTEFDYFFAGQITHERRQQMAVELNRMHDTGWSGYFYPTKGFTQGLKPADYYKAMLSSKIVPCASGPETPDTFRLFEALEAGCIPIADTLIPSNKDNSDFGDNYWTWVFSEPPPFPQISNWSNLPQYAQELMVNWKNTANEISAWWLRMKQRYAKQLREDIEDVSGLPEPKQTVTAIIPISVIPSHPLRYILEETINSIRHHYPDIEIILTFDGIRQEQMAENDRYQEHISRVLWQCHNVWKNVSAYVFKEHMHQIGMARHVLEHVTTPLILYVEQDTPLVTDEPIEWDHLEQKILDGTANLIRFHHEAHIPEEHKSMMLGEPEDKLQKTVQWSQRPHLASTLFYRRILTQHFSEDAKCFIEDKMHSVLHQSFVEHGTPGWNEFRTFIYFPAGQIKRSYHTDGRDGTAKYDTSQVF